VPVPPLETAAPPDPTAPPPVPFDAWVPPVPAGELLEGDPHAPATTADRKRNCKSLVIDMVLAPPAGMVFSLEDDRLSRTVAPDDRSLRT
jgi:hypothetical protein